MDEKTASTLRLDTKGRKGPRRCSPCLKLGIWFTACSALVLIALVMLSTLWTLVTYHRTVTALQDRLYKLESEVESSKHNIDQIVEEKIKYILKERFQTVTVEADTVRRKDPTRVVRQACSCPPGPEGPKGNMGGQGDVGFPGPIGLKGQLGLPGPKGGKGDMGDTGHEGQKGDGGLPGYDGIVGQKGERGPQGLSGGIGPEWVEKVLTLTGEPGEPGRLGPLGPAGPIGKPGLPGFDGLPGDLGPQGPSGPAGPQGPSGRDGRPGDPSGIGEKKRRRCRLEVIPRTEHRARKQGSIGREDNYAGKGFEEHGPGGTEVFNNPETAEEISPDALESVPGEPVVKRKRRNRKKKNKDNMERRKTRICTDENGVQHIIRRVRRDTLEVTPVEMMVGLPGPPGPPGPLTSALDGSCQCSKGDKGDRGRDGRRGKRGRKGDKGDRGIPGLDAPCPLGKDGLPLPGCYYEMPDKGEPTLDSQLCPIGPGGRRDCSLIGNTGPSRNP